MTVREQYRPRHTSASTAGKGSRHLEGLASGPTGRSGRLQSIKGQEKKANATKTRTKSAHSTYRPNGRHCGADGRPRRRVRIRFTHDRRVRRIICVRGRRAVAEASTIGEIMVGTDLDHAVRTHRHRIVQAERGQIRSDIAPWQQSRHQRVTRGAAHVHRVIGRIDLIRVRDTSGTVPA